MVISRILITSLALGPASACVTGPETEPKSKLNYLNGDHYKATNTLGGGIPIPITIERQVVATTIEGQAVIDRSELYQPALKFADVALLHGTDELARVTTDQNGRFSFSLELGNGTYRVHAANDEFVGDVKVVVTEYQIKNVVLKVTPRVP